jgi:DNA helicase-2/ATP-dependent DNA helicase PcrA
MKERIQKLLGCYVPFNWMGTFHSVCLKLLKLCLGRDAAVKAMGSQWYDSNFSIYDDDDQKRVLKEILKEDLGENFEASEVKKLHAAISKYKNTILNKGGFAQLQTPDIALEMATFADE